MSRKERFGSRRDDLQPLKSKHGLSETDESLTEGSLPQRRKKFPSSSQKITKWYYNFLFILFVCLVAGLFWYGKKFAE